MGPDDLREASDANLVVAIGRFRPTYLYEAYGRHAGAAFGLAHRSRVRQPASQRPPDPARRPNSGPV